MDEDRIAGTARKLGGKVDVVPAQSHQFRGPETMSVSDQDSRGDQCPLYPQKRTSLTTTEMSALCQKQTFRPLLDIIVGGQGCSSFVEHHP